MKDNLLIMRNLFVLLSFILLSSCGKSNDKRNDSKVSADAFHLTDTVSKKLENPKIAEYEAFIAKLDSADMTSATKAAIKYKEIFADQPASLCDSGFVVFQALYDSVEQNLSNKHQNDTVNYEPLLYDDQASVPKALKDYRKNLLLNGFKISASEGVTYVEQDRSFIAKNFYTFVTQAMKAYLTELQQENKEGFAMNGAITISPRKLVDRNIWYEKFIEQNPDFVFADNCKKYQKAYLTYLLCGYENTAIYTNREAQSLSDFYVNAYDYLISKFPKSQTAQTVSSYYNALKLKQASNAQSILKSYRIKGLIYSVK